MPNIWKQIRSFGETVDETTSAIRGLLWVLVMVAATGVAIRHWLKSLDTLQLSLLMVVLLCLLLIGLTYFLDWRRKRNIDNLPELLSQLDQLTLDYIDGLVPHSKTPEALVNDLANLLGMDIGQLKHAMLMQNHKLAQQEFYRLSSRYEKLANLKKLPENLLTLRLMGGLMNEYNVGLAHITDVEEYRNLFQRIKRLQKRLPTAAITAKVTEYFSASDGLYSLLLSTKPFTNLSTLKELIPARERAHSLIMRSVIEGYTATLISAVRESIEKCKNKEKEK